MDEGWTMTAREMVDHFGREAAGIAARRAAELARRGDWRGADRALLLLTGVERLEAGGTDGREHA